jgi:hypothetical protein
MDEFNVLMTIRTTAMDEQCVAQPSSQCEALHFQSAQPRLVQSLMVYQQRERRIVVIVVDVCSTGDTSIVKSVLMLKIRGVAANTCVWEIVW